MRRAAAEAEKAALAGPAWRSACRALRAAWRARERDSRARQDARGEEAADAGGGTASDGPGPQEEKVCACVPCESVVCLVDARLGHGAQRGGLLDRERLGAACVPGWCDSPDRASAAMSRLIACSRQRACVLGPCGRVTDVQAAV